MIKKDEKSNILSVICMISFAISLIANGNITTVAKYSSDWKADVWFMAFSKWAIPLLIMTVGYCYLNSKYNFSLESLSEVSYFKNKELNNRSRSYFKKDKAFRMRGMVLKSIISCLIIWIFSSLFYMSHVHNGEYDFDTLLECMSKVLKEPYFIAFYQLIVMLFVFYPLLKQISNSKKLTTYAVILFLAIAIVNRLIVFIPFGKYVYMFTSQINWNNFTAYGLYLFVGIFISRINLKWYIRMIFYLSFFIITAGMYSLFIFNSIGKVDKALLDELQILLSGIQACAVFVLVMQLSKRINKHIPFVKMNVLSESLYMYVAVFVILYFALNDSINFHGMAFVWQKILEVLILLVLSLTVCIILRKIPFIKRITT